MEFKCPPDPLQEILRPFPAFFGRSFLRSRTQLEVSLQCFRGQVRPFHFNFVRGIYIRNLLFTDGHKCLSAASSPFPASRL